MAKNKNADHTNAEDELIKRNPIGQITMSASNFDFIDKPIAMVEPIRQLDKSNSAKYEIEKVFKKMAKQKDSLYNFKS